MTSKWIAMAGLRTYMPNICEEFDDRDSAIDFLAEIHKLGPESILLKELTETGYTDLDYYFYGNEYVEVIQKEETE